MTDTKLKVSYDASGFISSISIPEAALSHGETPVDDFLAHYGVLGMKWGVRRSQAQLNRAAGRRRANPNYSKNQRKRDTQVYGKRGAKRINKAMNKGETISVARGAEKTRRDKVTSKNKYVRQGGKVGGAALGIGTVIVGSAAFSVIANRPETLKLVGAIFAKAPFGVKVGAANAMVVARQLASIMDTPQFTLLASAGAAKVATMFAGDMAVNARMRAHGYDPNRR